MEFLENLSSGTRCISCGRCWNKELHRYNKKSFTFIELVIVLILVIILAGASVRPIMKFWQLWQFVNHRMAILWSSRAVLEDMATNIRMLTGVDDIYAATSTHFEFDIEDENSNIIRVDYEFIGSDLFKNSTLFASDVAAGGFTYYPNSSDIQSVEVDLTLTSGDETLASEVRVKCRNLD